MDDLGIFCDGKDTARANSLMVAQMFGKEHKHVLDAVREIMSDDDDGFNQPNFRPISYTDNRGRRQPAFAMTRDGFTLLAMGFVGKKAMQFKKAYIKRFNEMEQYIRAMVSARQQFPLLTENIKLLYDDPKPYHFSNECDMLNRLVLGMTAKQYRETYGIPKGESIRPYLSQEQITQLDMLQAVDVGLLVAEPDFQKRKRLLEWYLAKKLAA